MEKEFMESIRIINIINAARNLVRCLESDKSCVSQHKVLTMALKDYDEKNIPLGGNR